MINEYPEIEFLDTNTEKEISRMILKFEEITQRTLYPASRKGFLLRGVRRLWYSSVYSLTKWQK